MWLDVFLLANFYWLIVVVAVMVEVPVAEVSVGVMLFVAKSSVK